MNCNSLKTLDSSNFSASKITNMINMFHSCSNLETIYVSDLWDISNATTATMFYGTWKLVGAVSFDSTKTDATMANYTNGYLTYKKNTN